MAILFNKSQNKILISDLKIANTFYKRGKGLLGQKSLSPKEGLWISPGILPCNSIHTFFMKFSIDCVFLDKSFKVQKIFSSVRPGLIIPPVKNANSVVELAEGIALQLNIQVGDQLHVGN